MRWGGGSVYFGKSELGYMIIFHFDMFILESFLGKTKVAHLHKQTYCSVYYA